MMEKRTDLALEIRESFPEDDVEISGVALKEREEQRGRIHITTVEIRNEQGARQMGKPIGTYVTVEFAKKYHCDSEQLQEETREKAAKQLAEILKKMVDKQTKNCADSVLVVGLGNRFATPDALGPFVLEDIEVNRHIWKEFGKMGESGHKISALAPGVMAQTGMESQEILGGLIKEVSPDCLLVIDSLASRSVNRLCTTIQITDTGICPGAGIGNNRNALNQESLGVPVIAIGVPTVVDAGTIVSECMEETLSGEGYDQNEIDLFLQGVSKKRVENLFVTPKDIDEQIRQIGKVVAEGINQFTKEV